MFFVLHYTLFNAGLSASLILLTLYLQTYSDASLTEIGALLMLLPFVSIVCKPLFCALADRQQAHRQYLAGALLVTATGYGSIAIAPFFPEFVAKHGRLVWYLDVVGVLVGYSGFGIVWSLGDALAVNMARCKGVPWGSYRVWGTVSWGAFGWLVGQINETPALPRYVPALFVLVGSMSLEALLVMIWDKRCFDMSAETQQQEQQQAGAKQQQAEQQQHKEEQDTSDIFDESHWPSAGSAGGTLTGSVRTNPRLMGAVANIFMEDLAGSLKSSLKLGAPARRVALSDLLREHADKAAAADLAQPSPALSRKQPPLSPIAPSKALQLERQDSASGGGIRQRGWSRTQLMLSHMNSLSSASGNAIADQLRDEFAPDPPSPAPGNRRQHNALVMSSLASNTSLGRAAAARAVGLGHSSTLKEAGGGGEAAPGEQQAAAVAATETKFKSVEDLQLILLKLIVKRDRSILKYLVLFTLFGALFAIHTSYFFLYVERLARAAGYDFSSIAGMYCLAESVSEIFSFLVVVPHWMPRVGRLGSFLTCALMFATRYLYYGTYFAHLSLYWGLLTELCHGIAYAITYSLITDIASECVDQLDSHMAELVERRIITPQMNPNELKLPLRATMQGVFSGAFDGLGNGLGCLFAGIYLDSLSFAHLSLLCTYLSLVIMVVYPLSEWRARRQANALDNNNKLAA